MCVGSQVLTIPSELQTHHTPQIRNMHAPTEAITGCEEEIARERMMMPCDSQHYTSANLPVNQKNGADTFASLDYQTAERRVRQGDSDV